MNSSLSATGGANYPQIDIEELKRKGNIFRENTGASIIDIGDRIGLVEFHTKANSISEDLIEILSVAIKEGVEKFDAIVIGNRGRHFSAGANLSSLLESARSGKWKEIEQGMSRLQETNMLLKYGPVPVVAAPFSNTLGGGAEIVLHSSKVVASDDLHLGLVEAGVGLIPAGGGTKEFRLRALSNFADEGNADLMSALQNVLKTILSARVSRNGEEAKHLFLANTDIIVPTKESPIELAKQVALELVHAGYHNEGPKKDIPVPGITGIGIFQNLISHLLDSKKISEHDAVIAQHIATVLCGGNVMSGIATEQHLLDLEREAFISLLGTQKTQERIDFLLKNNKPLHN
jgi:3-hydroxyacyl-CoA dehydrogenase